MLFRLAGIGIEVFFGLLWLGLLFRRLRESRGFQLDDTLEGIGGQALALGLVALDGNELLGIDLLLSSEGICSAVCELDTGVEGIGEQDELRGGVLREPVLLPLRGIHQEALQIGVALVVGIIEDGCPYLISLVFLDAQDILFVVVVQIEVGEIALAALQDYEDLIIVVELAQQTAVLIVVQAVHIGIIPHLAASEGRVAVTLQSDAVHGVLRQQVTL